MRLSFIPMELIENKISEKQTMDQSERYSLASSLSLSRTNTISRSMEDAKIWKDRKKKRFAYTHVFNSNLLIIDGQTVCMIWILKMVYYFRKLFKTQTHTLP